MLAVLIAGALSWGAWVGEREVGERETEAPQDTPQHAEVTEVDLPVAWGDIGMRLVEEGVIDLPKLEEIYASRGGLGKEAELLMSNMGNEKIRMTRDNANTLLNILWAFGLANKNPVLEKGPMMDPKYGGAGNFASTGGWTIAKGDPMSHYSAYEFVKLTKQEQEKVERVAQGIYRPCCNNSTYFPDCNHGMAMLGLLELMAANNVSEKEMYEVALGVNRLWFQGTYEVIDTYVKEQGLAGKVSAKDLLGSAYSSGSGFGKVFAEVQKLPESKQEGGCGV